MNGEQEIQITQKGNRVTRLHLFVVVLTLFGLGLFIYFVSSVGIHEILRGVGRIGFGGFALILFLYFLKIVSRALAWKLSVYEPYELSLKDTTEAVIIGEALSSMIPLGILISGTAKAVAVRKKVPLVVGLSSVATENLFYSLGTGLLIVFGALAFLKTFDIPEGWAFTLDALIGIIFLLIFVGLLMVVRQWHWASAICEKLYAKGFLRKYLEDGRLHVRLFENLIYGFYRRYPKRFLPIFLLQVAFHALGVLEVWFILSRIGRAAPSLYAAFLLESISRVVTVFFKLIPFVIGVDEMGARFVTHSLALGAGVGVTLAIIRKGRTLFWTAVGIALILWRGLSLSEITKIGETTDSEVNPQM